MFHRGFTKSPMVAAPSGRPSSSPSNKSPLKSKRIVSPNNVQAYMDDITQRRNYYSSNQQLLINNNNILKHTSTPGPLLRPSKEVVLEHTIARRERVVTFVIYQHQLLSSEGEISRTSTSSFSAEVTGIKQRYCFDVPHSKELEVLLQLMKKCENFILRGNTSRPTPSLPLQQQRVAQLVIQATTVTFTGRQRFDSVSFNEKSFSLKVKKEAIHLLSLSASVIQKYVRRYLVMKTSLHHLSKQVRALVYRPEPARGRPAAHPPGGLSRGGGGGGRGGSTILSSSQPGETITSRKTSIGTKWNNQPHAEFVKETLRSSNSPPGRDSDSPPPPLRSHEDKGLSSWESTRSPGDDKESVSHKLVVDNITEVQYENTAVDDERDQSKSEREIAIMERSLKLLLKKETRKRAKDEMSSKRTRDAALGGGEFSVSEGISRLKQKASVMRNRNFVMRQQQTENSEEEEEMQRRVVSVAARENVAVNKSNESPKIEKHMKSKDLQSYKDFFMQRAYTKKSLKAENEERPTSMLAGERVAQSEEEKEEGGGSGQQRCRQEEQVPGARASLSHRPAVDHNGILAKCFEIMKTSVDLSENDLLTLFKEIELHIGHFLLQDVVKTLSWADNLISTVLHFRNDTDIVLAALRIAVFFPYGKIGFCDMVHSALAPHLNDEDFCCEVLHYGVKLTSKSGRIDVEEHTGLEILFKILLKYGQKRDVLGNSPKVVTACLKYVRNICISGSENTRDSVVAAGVGGSLLKLMVFYRTDEAVVAPSCHSIARLCHNTKYISQFASCECIHLYMLILNTNSSKKTIAKAVGVLLIELYRTNTNTLEEIFIKCNFSQLIKNLLLVQSELSSRFSLSVIECNIIMASYFITQVVFLKEDFLKVDIISTLHRYQDGNQNFGKNIDLVIQNCLKYLAFE